MFKNLKISTRLVAGFTLLVAMLLAIGALSIYRTMAVQADLVDITERRMKVIADTERLRDATNFQARAIRNVALFTDPAKVAEERKAITESRRKVEEQKTELAALMQSEKGRELQNKLLSTRKPFDESVDKFLSIMAAGETEAAVAYLFDTVRPTQLEYLKAIDAAVAYQQEGAQASSQQAQATVRNLIMMIGVAVLLAAAVATGVAMWIIRSITGPINNAIDLARAVAAGDLTRVVEVKSKTRPAC
jgi:methyl-accepting chemotaxis protein